MEGFQTVLQVALAAALLALLAAPAAAGPNKLPPEFKLCRRDENMIPCLNDALLNVMELIAPGLPDFGIPSLEPLVVPQLGFGDTDADKPVNLRLNFTNINIFNLKTVKITNYKVDLDKFVMSAHGHMDHVFADADYVMDGRIVLIPAIGQGKVAFNLTNMDAEVTIKGTKNIKKGKEYWKVTELKFNFVNLDKLKMHFDNLFNGDQTLGPTVNNLINENWTEIWDQLKPPLAETFQYTFREYAKRIFDKVPLQDIFLPRL